MSAPLDPASTRDAPTVGDEQPSGDQPLTPKAQASPPSRSRVRPLNIALAVCVLVLAGALVFVLLRMGGDSSPDPGASATSSSVDPPQPPSEARRLGPPWAIEPDGTVLPEGLMVDEMWGVVPDGVPVYRGPGTSYETGTPVRQYTTVELIGYMPGIDDFTYVRYSVEEPDTGWVTDCWGWVESASIQLPEKALVWPVSRRTGVEVAQVVPATGLNLRTGPGTNYDIIVLIPQYGEVEPTGCTFSAQEDGWGFVRYQLYEGWVATEYLTSFDTRCW